MTSNATIIPGPDLLAPRTKKRILVADDNLVVLKVLSLKLAACGYEVVTVTEISKVVQRIAAELPDLVLLDLHFAKEPSFGSVEWDGFKALQWLQRLEQIRQIPIIVVTADQSPDTRERVMKSGANALFTKPLEFDRVLAKMRARWCRMTGRTSARS